ncbi:MAG: outer membrane beta-barrel protein [Proteobacteria bacterium]|nr:outer membrane beta-barrel protein [Pseudomonadota bacterium]
MSLYSKSCLGTLISSFMITAINANAQEKSFENTLPSYRAEGVTVGSFNLRPELTVEEQFNDNIFSTENNEEEDFITVIKPGLSLKSDWSRHSLNTYANANIGLYNDNDSENYEDFAIGLNGRLDVLRETFITAGVDYKDRHENRGSPDNNINSIHPTEYDEFTSNIGIYRGVRKVSVRLNGEFKNLDFDDGVTSSGANIDNDNRDRDQYRTSIRVGYEFMQDYEAFIRAVYDSRFYDDTTTLNRNSDGYEISVGSSVNITGTIRGDIYLGYMQQEYDDASLNKIGGIDYGAELFWNATPLTQVQAGIERVVEETSLANLSGYISTAYNVSVEHELRRNILLGANAAFITNDYESSSINEREDDFFVAVTEAKYLMNRNLDLKLNYTYQNRHSNIVNQDYTKNIITFGANVAF